MRSTQNDDTRINWSINSTLSGSRLIEGFLALEDGDTLSPAEAKAIAEADEWLRHNKPIPHEKVLAELGLTMAEWEEMARG